MMHAADCGQSVRVLGRDNDHHHPDDRGEEEEEDDEEDRPAVSVDTTMVRSDVETINIEKEEDDVKSPDMATMLPQRRLARSPQQRSGCWRHPARSS
jgi:hypothetical protein